MKRCIKKICCWSFKAVCWAVTGYALLLVVRYGSRVFLCDTFRIPTPSMEPTLIPGDKIIVNKLIFGPRIYWPLSSAQTEHPVTYRLKGLRGIRHNDVVVFNGPQRNGYIGFNVNYVYCKRCVGLPGDSIAMKTGYIYNNNYFKPLALRSMQHVLHAMPDSVLQQTKAQVYQASPAIMPWTMRDLGPIYVPRCSDVIPINKDNFYLYRQIIEFESRANVYLASDSTYLLNKKVYSHYRFRKNYYYMMGDNIVNSSDSRCWGFVPEEYIIGVAVAVLYSVDPDEGSWRCGRFWKSLCDEPNKN